MYQNDTMNDIIHDLMEMQKQIDFIKEKIKQLENIIAVDDGK